MKHSLASLLLAGAALLPVSLATPVRAATMILHNFGADAGDGQYPQSSLVLSGSTLYGTTDSGGSSGKGVVFSMNADGSGYTLLHNFTGGASDGNEPLSSLTIVGSKLYGLTYHGGSSSGSGSGTLFSMNTDGTGFALLHTFTNIASDGGGPLGSLAASGSKLYGMTRQGGTHNLGTIFSTNLDGTGFTLLRSFDGNDAAQPGVESLLLVGSKLYGISSSGGPGFGTAFSLATDGTGFAVIHNFLQTSSDGGEPSGALTLFGSKLYGMSATGGITSIGGSGGGTVFSMNTDGTGFSLLHIFKGGANDGFVPWGSLTLSGSMLYGMTQYGGTSGATGSGTLFSINADGTGFSLLERFGMAPGDGVNPQYNNLTLSADASTLYGMTALGGTANKGVVFSQTIATPEPGVFALLGSGAVLLLRRRCAAAR